MSVYNFKHNLLPSCCMNLLQTRSSSGPYFLRHEIDFVKIPFRTVLRKKSISIVGPELWNCLPEVVKLSVSLLIFKKRLVDFLKNTYSNVLEN